MHTHVASVLSLNARNISYGTTNDYSPVHIVQIRYFGEFLREIFEEKSFTEF